MGNCRRCGGFLVEDSDQYSRWFRCLMCGRGYDATVSLEDHQNPKVQTRLKRKRYQAEYQAEYNNRSENKVKRKKHLKQPKVMERKRKYQIGYRRRPEVKERRRKYQLKYRQTHKKTPAVTIADRTVI